MPNKEKSRIPESRNGNIQTPSAASQEEQNSSFVAPSSEELWVQIHAIYTHMVKVVSPLVEGAMRLKQMLLDFFFHTL